MNKNKLKSIMVEFGETQEMLADGIGISRTRLNMKINETGGAVFTQPEINKIKQRYNLTASDVEDIFFC